MPSGDDIRDVTIVSGGSGPALVAGLSPEPPLWGATGHGSGPGGPSIDVQLLELARTSFEKPEALLAKREEPVAGPEDEGPDEISGGEGGVDDDSVGDGKGQPDGHEIVAAGVEGQRLNRRMPTGIGGQTA